MASFDLAPLYRSAVGFDRFARLFDEALRSEQSNYPPYNIELVAENQYRITMALAGFVESELDLEVEGDVLTVTGRRSRGDDATTFLHRGIAMRDFTHRFRLADHVQVTGARLEHGLLAIELVHETPEAMKPRKVPIGATLS
ncbi:Hsp20 family protein [Chitinibacteraceae bacterium HSL-7]